MRLYGVNYDIRNGPDWLTIDNGRCKPYDQIVSELTQLRDMITNRIRVYSINDCDTAATVLRASQEVGDMQVWLGLWASEDPAVFEGERARFLDLLSTVNMDNVIGVHVSSEAIYREEITVSEAVALREIIKDDLVAAGIEAPVTVADIIDTYLANPQLVAVDNNVVTFNQFPFWERTTNINDAAAYMSERVGLLENLARGRQIIVTETGWGDEGENEAANPANPPAMRKWLRDFVCLAESRNWQYFWFNAYDHDWRRINEDIPDDVEGHFGLFDEQGNLKPHIADLVIDCSEPAYTIDPNGSTDVPAAPSPVAPPAETPTEMPVDAPVDLPVVTVDPDGEPTAAPDVEKDVTDAPVTEEVPTAQPTLSPANAEPTTSPVSNVTDTETMAPVTAAPVDAAPTLSPVKNETDAPVSEPSASPVNPPTNETSAPNSTEAPSPSPVSVEESQQCCSAERKDGLTLECCDEVDSGVIAACSGNPQCDALQIPEFCCPTSDERYLDCCSVLPDKCADGGCTIFSAVQYKLDLMNEQSSTRKAIGADTTLLTVLSLVVALIL